MSENKNIDSLLMSVTQPVADAAEPVHERADESPLQDSPDTPDDSSSVQESGDEYEGDLEAEAPVAEAPDLDEYGHPIAKPRLYSEDEVQRMIRDRLARGNNVQSASPQQVQQVQQAAQDFQADPNNPDSWEHQLEAFIDKTLAKKQTQQQREQWERQERTTQAEFESKFTTSMARYNDFRDVVGGKPITNTMMLATRNMKDPAAFIYAAAKTQPKELERIAQITDPYQQAAEVGRLEERMRKTRAAASNTPKPITPSKGDMAEKGNSRPNLDARIHQYGRNKRRI